MLVGFITLAVLFAVQFVFCMMARTAPIKLIPTYVVTACGIFCAGLMTGVLSVDSLTALPEIAVTFSIISGVACIGTAAAWLVYAVIHFTANKK